MSTTTADRAFRVGVKGFSLGRLFEIGGFVAGAMLSPVILRRVRPDACHCSGATRASDPDPEWYSATPT